MEFEQDTSLEKFGKIAGYLTSYLLFTAGLYLALSLLNKLPGKQPYLQVIALTLVIVLIGLTNKKLLK